MAAISALVGSTSSGYWTSFAPPAVIISALGWGCTSLSDGCGFRLDRTSAGRSDYAPESLISRPVSQRLGFLVYLHFLGASKSQGKLIAQDVVATDLVDCGLALPTLAAQLAGDGPPSLGHGLGQGRAQIKIASDTLIVGTGEAE